jgi:hypothetical protein
MDQQNDIVNGAIVEATDGYVGTVIQLIKDPNTNDLQGLVVENEGQNKQITISSKLIGSVVGSRVVHLVIPGHQIENYASDTQIDTDTGNFGHPSPNTPKMPKSQEL